MRSAFDAERHQLQLHINELSLATAESESNGEKLEASLQTERECSGQLQTKVVTISFGQNISFMIMMMFSFSLFHHQATGVGLFHSSRFLNSKNWFYIINAKQCRVIEIPAKRERMLNERRLRCEMRYTHTLISLHFSLHQCQQFNLGCFVLWFQLARVQSELARERQTRVQLQQNATATVVNSNSSSSVSTRARSQSQVSFSGESAPEQQLISQAMLVCEA
jgi:hypothetical protein